MYLSSKSEEISMNYEENLLFTKEHVWIKKIQQNRYQLGISNFAQDLLGDIVFFDIDINKNVSESQSLGMIESVKTASEIICPQNCLVKEINADLIKNPELVNDEPHKTWICEIEFHEELNIEKFFTYENYLESIK